MKLRKIFKNLVMILDKAGGDYRYLYRSVIFAALILLGFGGFLQWLSDHSADVFVYIYLVWLAGIFLFLVLRKRQQYLGWKIISISLLLIAIGILAFQSAVIWQASATNYTASVLIPALFLMSLIMMPLIAIACKFTRFIAFMLILSLIIAIKIDLYYCRAASIKVGIAKYSTEDRRTCRRFGFIDKSGTMAIPADYDDADYFGNGLAPVKEGSYWQFIDHQGSIKISNQEIEKIAPFSEGLAAIKLNNKLGFGYINTIGKIVIEPRFKSAKMFCEGLAAVEDFKSVHNYDDTWGYINKRGAYVIKPKLAYAGDFTKGYAVVKTYNYYNYYPHIVGDLRNTSYVGIAGPSLAGDERCYNKYLIDHLDKAIANLKNATQPIIANLPISIYDDRLVFPSKISEGFITVDVESCYEGVAFWFFADESGIPVLIPKPQLFNSVPEFKSVCLGINVDYLDSFHEGLCGARVGGKWGFIDKKGRFIIKPRFDYVGRFSEGLAVVGYK